MSVESLKYNYGQRLLLDNYSTFAAHSVEGIFMELNLRNNKWLLFSGYNPKMNL